MERKHRETSIHMINDLPAKLLHGGTRMKNRRKTTVILPSIDSLL